MPLHLVDGTSTGRPFRAAGPCEWCGEMLAASECRPVSSLFSDDDGEPDGSTILTRMCPECIHVYAELGRDGLRERPADSP